MGLLSRVVGVAVFAGAGLIWGQTAAPPKYAPLPSFDLSSLDRSVDPCNDFYQFACGHFAANHPIPADQPDDNAFTELINVNSAELNAILVKYAKPDASRTPDQQKIGDDYAACMDTATIERRGLEPIAPLLKEIDSMTLFSLAGMTGKLQRMGVNVLFTYGEQQDFKDATKQIAVVDQGGLGLPERDYYLRTGAKDVKLRKDYVAHITKMLVLSGVSPEAAAKQAAGILVFETGLAKASIPVAERREPESIYHLVPASEVAKNFPMGLFTQFEKNVHAPHVTELNDANPAYIPALIQQVKVTDIATLRAYFRYQLLTTFNHSLPQRLEQENFNFYSRELNGAEAPEPRWKRCSTFVNYSLGEALGEVYVQKYFAGDSKPKVVQMVADIEAAMDRDIDSLEWMSAPTKVRAKEKLHSIANKIGYPEHFRDYSAVTIKPDDALGDAERANEFENDRQLAKIGKPVDHGEWEMTPPQVDAYFDASMNDMNFPAGILQPSFFDPKMDDAVNYGHIGGVIGHELTHGFDDQGRKFDAKGNLNNWWAPEDVKKYEARTDCLVAEYGKFVPVDDVHIDGKLTLGENTADNGGLLLAWMAYLDRAKKTGVDLSAKVDGFTSPQRFYIAWAQNWCSNDRPEALRTHTLTDEHAATKFRANGPIVNQPGFAGAFACKQGSPMVPVNSCRVW